MPKRKAHKPAVTKKLTCRHCTQKFALPMHRARHESAKHSKATVPKKKSAALAKATANPLGIRKQVAAAKPKKARAKSKAVRSTSPSKRLPPTTGTRTALQVELGYKNEILKRTNEIMHHRAAIIRLEMEVKVLQQVGEVVFPTTN